MPETDLAPCLHVKRFLVAATCATAAVALAIAIDLTSRDLAVPNALMGAARAGAAVLWVFWFVAYLIGRVMHSISPEAAAYAAGYVDGVARRYPPVEQRVTYLR